MGGAIILVTVLICFGHGCSSNNTHSNQIGGGSNIGGEGPLYVLQSMKGSCGDRDDLFQLIARCLGFESSRVNFFSIPIQLGHLATEVIVNGHHQFYDSSFGLFFNASDDDNLSPLSIDTARKNFPNFFPMHTTLKST